MNESANPLFGRKIFFLNPPYAISKTGIEKLRAQEYEAYSIENYKVAKTILRENKDAICFIDIDSDLSITEWFNFIKSFETDEILSTIYVGILSQKIRTSEKNQFLLKASIPGGFIMLTEGLESVIERIIKICEFNGAKGRRQYVRLDCKDEKNAIVHVTKESKLYTMRLIDISSVGFACSLPVTEKNKFVEKEVVKSIIITLGSKTITCEAAIFAMKETPNYCLLVMLLLPNTPQSTKKLIRNYVFSTLQNNLDNKLRTIPNDMTDYSIEPQNIHNDSSQKFIKEDILDNDFDADDASDLEDISDVPEMFV